MDNKLCSMCGEATFVVTQPCHLCYTKEKIKELRMVILSLGGLYKCYGGEPILPEDEIIKILSQIEEKFDSILPLLKKKCKDD